MQYAYLSYVQDLKITDAYTELINGEIVIIFAHSFLSGKSVCLSSAFVKSNKYVESYNPPCLIMCEINTLTPIYCKFHYQDLKIADAYLN